MSEPRLKARIWVQAQIRVCTVNLIPIAVTHTGDADAGTVLLRLLGRDGRSRLVRRATTADDQLAWMEVGGAGAVAAAEADAYVAREVARDRDLWVLEIEDFDGRYQLDAPIAQRRP